MKKDVIIQTNDQAITKLAEEIGIQIKPRETEDEIPYEIVEYEEVLETANETERKTARVRRSRAKQRLGVLLFIILASLAIVYLTTPKLW